jgi:hypothetical protein
VLMARTAGEVDGFSDQLTHFDEVGSWPAEPTTLCPAAAVPLSSQEQLDRLIMSLLDHDGLDSNDEHSGLGQGEGPAPDDASDAADSATTHAAVTVQDGMDARGSTVHPSKHVTLAEDLVQEFSASTVTAAPADSEASTASESAEGGSSAAGEPAPQPQRKRRTRRGRRGRASGQVLSHDGVWPVIPDVLHPYAPSDLAGKLRAGCYAASVQDVQAHKDFFSRSPTLASLPQKDPVTSLHILSEDGSRRATPASVMVDTGANVVIMVSPKVAAQLRLTTEPGSAPLKGVGGVGGSLGRSRERVLVRLGGAAGGKDDPSPFSGCFSMSCHPVVMEQRLVDDIGYDVLLGQGYIRLCLGMVDPLSERFHYSPAWLQHGCADFRVSVPCQTSKPSVTAEPTGVMLLGEPLPDPRTHCVDAQWPTALAAAAGTAAAPVTLGPGFPQVQIPSREQYRQQRQEHAQRRAADRATAQQAVASAHHRAVQSLSRASDTLGCLHPFRELRRAGLAPSDGAPMSAAGASDKLLACMQQCFDTLLREALSQAGLGKPAEAPREQADAAAQPAAGPVPAAGEAQQLANSAKSAGDAPRPSRKAAKRVQQTRRPFRIGPVVAAQRNPQPGTTVRQPHAAGVNWFVPGMTAAVTLRPRHQARQ